jgi:hypothetical protein
VEVLVGLLRLVVTQRLALHVLHRGLVLLDGEATVLAVVGDGVSRVAGALTVTVQRVLHRNPCHGDRHGHRSRVTPRSRCVDHEVLHHVGDARLGVNTLTVVLPDGDGEERLVVATERVIDRVLACLVSEPLDESASLTPRHDCASHRVVVRVDDVSHVPRNLKRETRLALPVVVVVEHGAGSDVANVHGKTFHTALYEPALVWGRVVPCYVFDPLLSSQWGMVARVGRYCSRGRFGPFPLAFPSTPQNLRPFWH